MEFAKVSGVCQICLGTCLKALLPWHLGSETELREEQFLERNREISPRLPFEPSR